MVFRIVEVNVTASKLWKGVLRRVVDGKRRKKKSGELIAGAWRNCCVTYEGERERERENLGIGIDC